MKKARIIVIIILLLIGAGFAYILLFGEAEKLSEAQEELVETFGYPKQFSISYLPYNEDEANRTLMRTETWTYPDHQYEITFIAGEIFSTEEIEAETGEITYSDLTPDLFEFEMDYDAVVEAVGSKTVEKVDAVPELFIEGEVETYVSDHVFFTIEHGYLTYVETVGIELGEEDDDN